MTKCVWLFNGNGGYSKIPSAIFRKKNDAMEWIYKNKLTGILTKYDVDIPIFEWAIKNNLLTVKDYLSENEKVIEDFYQILEHYKFNNGEMLLEQ